MTIAAIVYGNVPSDDPPVVCAWCPGFDPKASPPNATHGMCAICEVRVREEFGLPLRGADVPSTAMASATTRGYCEA